MLLPAQYQNYLWPNIDKLLSPIRQILKRALFLSSPTDSSQGEHQLLCARLSFYHMINSRNIFHKTTRDLTLDSLEIRAPSEQLHVPSPYLSLLMSLHW